MGRCRDDELDTIGDPVPSTVTTLVESADRPWGAEDLEPSVEDLLGVAGPLKSVRANGLSGGIPEVSRFKVTVARGGWGGEFDHLVTSYSDSIGCPSF